LIYKFELGFEVFAIRFVTAVSGMYLTIGDVYVIVCLMTSALSIFSVLHNFRQIAPLHSNAV